MSFGKRLRQLREEKDLTLRELQKEIDISFSTLGKYERDERQPDFDTLTTLADYFEVTIDYLLGRDERNKSGLHQALEIIDKTILQLNPDSILHIPDEILSGLVEGKINRSKLSLIPVYSKVNGSLKLTKINATKYEFKYKNEMSEEKNFYIIAPDDSMNGSNITPGAKVLCSKLELVSNSSLESGKIYLVSYQDELLFRRVFITDTGFITLQADNIHYPPIIIQDKSDLDVIGIVQSVEFNPNEE